MKSPRHPSPTWAFATLTGLLCLAGSTTIYRCDGAGGVAFSDVPCGANAETVAVTDRRLGGTLDSGREAPGKDMAAPTENPPAEPPDTEPSTCRTFLSTDLRAHLIREEVVRGMTREHVRQAWGEPSETYAAPLEMWTYDNTYYGRLVSVTRVYFEDGCVREVAQVDP